jgi:hypothetical protein
MKTPVRVFISSSFDEMADERDILARRVIPALRAVCDAHNVALVDIDLRWGITGESGGIERLDQLVGPEISRAALFVVLVGKRFGWVPPGEYDSTTALEIYRAIATPSLNLLAFWRDPAGDFSLAGGGDSGTDIEQEKLIRRLEWLRVPLRKYGSHGEFAEKSHLGILDLLERLYFSKFGALFLSYSRKDHELAAQIGSILRALRFNVWQDSSSIEAGTNWPEQLAAGIEESDAVLFLASANSASSPYCSKEIAHATNLRKPLITVHIDDAILPKRIAFLVSDSQHLWLGRHKSLDAAAAEISSAARRLITEGRAPNKACHRNSQAAR